MTTTHTIAEIVASMIERAATITNVHEADEAEARREVSAQTLVARTRAAQQASAASRGRW